MFLSVSCRQIKICIRHCKKNDFVLVFKPTLPDQNGKVKGNIDADLVLRIMIDYKDNNFDKALNRNQ